MLLVGGAVLCQHFSGCLPSGGDYEAGGVTFRDSGQRPVEVVVAECAVCHGALEAQRGPILNGMDRWYLTEQLKKFRSGVRGANPANRSEFLMGTAVKKLRDDLEMVAVADWFARQKTTPAIRTVQGDLAAGQKLYATRCASCHGDEAQGKAEVNSPSLTQLEGWYFLEQLKKFRAGTRGHHPADVDGKVMGAALADLTNAQLRDVTSYIVKHFGPPAAPTLLDVLRGRFKESDVSDENITNSPEQKTAP